MRHHHLETRRHIVASRSMSNEAKRLTALIEGLRRSMLDIRRQRAKTKLSDPASRILDQRRDNLRATIAALEDRLSAVQGLLHLGRPHVVHRVH
ncbi:MAG: hypothetical protein HY852_01050 [Bradyrhizobium sp.]|uniref:hypothetical protein n=1 Tax=Bradyrhizobium sp. TaxID=376 RepID=UPI0025BF5C40|nr:hypothetical protein [Bradyrhizobium sp.]MBI5260388.1 hypothetical protein [Bradyrhizobium sp.]